MTDPTRHHYMDWERHEASRDYLCRVCETTITEDEANEQDGLCHWHVCAGCHGREPEAGDIYCGPCWDKRHPDLEEER